MHATIRSIVVLTCGMMAAHAGLAATASVSVKGGLVVLTPSPVVVPAADRSVRFQLTTTGYSIVGIGVAGGSTRYACTLADAGQAVTCRKGVNSGAGEISVTLTVQQDGGPALPPGNFWIQND